MDDEERHRLADALKKAIHVAAAPPSVPSLVQIQRPISFTEALLRSILAGHKTQTRRPIRPQPSSVRDGVACDADGNPLPLLAAVGDQLWIREKWGRDHEGKFVYALDGLSSGVRWIASRYMPRAAARHSIQVTAFRVERLQSITTEDAACEGIAMEGTLGLHDTRERFLHFWDSIYGETEWAAPNDPWVWVLTVQPITS